MLVWYSDSFNAKLPEKIEALIKNKNQENNTDLIFNSILHLLKVEGFPYNLNNSIFIQNQNNK